MRSYYEFFLKHGDLLQPSVSYPDEAASYFRFSFVRDPLRRCVSAYWNKICFAPPGIADAEDGAYLNGVNDQFFDLHYEPLGFRKGMAFEEFVQVLIMQPKQGMDSHLIPQVSIINFDDRQQVDFVGRVERFSEDIGRMFPEEISDLSSLRFNEGDAQPVTDVREEVFHNLVSYYADDYRWLRYEPLLPKDMRII